MRSSSFGLALVLGPLVLGGCSNGSRVYGHDPLGHGGSGGSSTTSTGDGGDLLPGSGGAATQCDGSCVGIGPDGFDEAPSMMWIGAPADVPPCPEIAPLVGFEGFAELHVAPHTCPACSCSPAWCRLPEAMHASAAKCPGDGAPSIAWDASPAWEGVCTAEGAVAAGRVCGGVPCVQSLTIEAPTVEPCQPAAGEPVPLPEPSWGQLARECRITASDTCPIEGYTCVPTPPDGFALCVHREGDESKYKCPPDYPDRFVIYTWVDDERTCAPCQCGEAEGASCSALVSMFKDGACGALVASYTLANEEPGCVDLPSGGALGSKSAVWVVDEPGSCAPVGGEALGEMQPGGAMTYCCQPGLVPAR